jgi:6,7-dimethyl-8-ribityllumazine synthase
MASASNYDALICLGCVIRGETPHFEYVSSAAALGIQKLSLGTDIPVIFGVLTTDTLEQAIDRAGAKGGNKGWECAMAALEMADLFRKFRPRKS